MNWQDYIFLHGAKRVSWDGIQTRTNFSFRGRTFHFPRSDSCLPSEARLDSLIKEREKFSQGKKSVRDCTFRPWIHNCHHGGHIFSLCRSLFNHQSIICITFTFLWMPLAKMSFMDAPFPNSTYLHSFMPF